MRGRARRAVLTAILVIAVQAAVAQISTAALRQADDALQAGEADRALGLLWPPPAAGPGAAEAQNLICRVRFALEEWDAAESACEKAVRLAPNSSIDHMWLGRALGQKASRASFLSAYTLGKRVRQEFETAVQLDPHSAAALFDLGDFYTDAPGIVVGGKDRAEGIAAQLDKVDPGKAYELRGDIAASRRDFAEAERDYKQAIAKSAHPAEEWTVLASFYRRRQQWNEMEDAIQRCVSAAALDPHPGVALYDGAGVLIEAHRDPALAAKMLETYLASSSKTEEGPAFIAHIRLGRLKQQLGDTAGAQREFTAAAAMAHEYHPAQDAKH